MSDRLNRIYIHSHDTGRCMEPYGYPVSMPAYQRIANEGIVVRQAFSAAPTCSPSRAALLTGQATHAAGMLGLARRGLALKYPNQHLAAYLGSYGYRTVLAGHQHLTTTHPDSLGYNTVLETSEVSGEVVAAHAVAFLTAASAEQRIVSRNTESVGQMKSGGELFSDCERRSQLTQFAGFDTIDNALSTPASAIASSCSFCSHSWSHARQRNRKPKPYVQSHHRDLCPPNGAFRCPIGRSQLEDRTGCLSWRKFGAWTDGPPPNGALSWCRDVLIVTTFCIERRNPCQRFPSTSLPPFDFRAGAPSAGAASVSLPER